MARFPAREAEIAALAGDIIHGLTQYTYERVRTLPGTGAIPICTPPDVGG